MPMFNLLYSSKNFRKTTGSFWNYYPDKPNSSYLGNNERSRVFYSMRNSGSFDYQTKLVGVLPDGDNPELTDTKIIIPLKNLSNFIFSLNFLIINTEIELILKWSPNCVLTQKAFRERRYAVAGNIPAVAVNAINTPSDLKFSITDCKLYVPVVTLQEKHDNELLKNLKIGISLDFEWVRYKTQIINQSATKNFLIDPTFNNVNALFVLAFPNEEDTSSFSKYYIRNV